MVKKPENQFVPNPLIDFINEDMEQQRKNQTDYLNQSIEWTMFHGCFLTKPTEIVTPFSHKNFVMNYDD
jgi:hypothetical protein